MTTYTAINLVKRPSGGPIGLDLFEKVEKDMPEPKEGQFLVRQTHMSLDPAMLGWMTPDTDSYIPPVELGTVMRSNGVGEVVASHHPDYQEGDRVMGFFGWQEYALSRGEGVNKLDSSLHPEMVLSVLSTPGLTATKGLFDFGQPKKGETLIVTGAAGSVGSIVGPLAKAEGLRVIGVAGTDEKCDWIVNTLGFDGAINYKTDDLSAKLEELAPEGIDVFFEKSGGEIQSLIFERMKAHGRIVVCGMIADYTGKPKPGPNWIPLIKKRLTIRGFTLPDHLDEAPQLMATLTPYLQAGNIQYRSHVLKGLDAAMTGLNLFFTGENKGKLIVEL